MPPDNFKIRSIFGDARRLALWVEKVGRVVSASDAARHLGVSKQRLNNLIESERVRSAKFGRNVFVPLSDVRSYRASVLSGKQVGGRGKKAPPAINTH